MQTCSLLKKEKTLPASDLQPHPTPPTSTTYTAWEGVKVAVDGEVALDTRF